MLDLLDLPATADVGFVTGAIMANFTALAAPRQRVLGNVGWDLDTGDSPGLRASARSCVSR